MHEPDQRWNGSGRAPYQVLVVPYFELPDGILYAIFKRSDAEYWQFVAGGGEGAELPIEAAAREAWEEAGVPRASIPFMLQSRSTVPVLELAGRLLWGAETLVVPEFTFGVRLTERALTISAEHTEYQWADFETCRSLLRWDSNRNALFELNHRLKNKMAP